MRISDWSSDVCSSDLGSRESSVGFRRTCGGPDGCDLCSRGSANLTGGAAAGSGIAGRSGRAGCPCGRFEILPGRRSEEHTSELQSLMRISYAVFCLKKKKEQIL